MEALLHEQKRPGSFVTAGVGKLIGLGNLYLIIIIEKYGLGFYVFKFVF